MGANLETPLSTSPRFVNVALLEQGGIRIAGTTSRPSCSFRAYSYTSGGEVSQSAGWGYNLIGPGSSREDAAEPQMLNEIEGNIGAGASPRYMTWNVQYCTAGGSRTRVIDVNVDRATYAATTYVYGEFVTLGEAGTQWANARAGNLCFGASSGDYPGIAYNTAFNGAGTYTKRFNDEAYFLHLSGGFRLKYMATGTGAITWTTLAYFLTDGTSRIYGTLRTGGYLASGGQTGITGSMTADGHTITFTDGLITGYV